MTEDQEKLRNVLMLYENLDKLEKQNKKCIESIRRHDIENALMYMTQYNATVSRILHAYEIVLIDFDDDIDELGR